MNFLSQFKKRRYLFIFTAIVIVLIVIVFMFRRGGEKDFETQKVIRADVVQSVSETGITAAVREVDLQFEQSGRVALVAVSEGERVLEGNVLIQLDRAEASANVLSAQANLRAEKANLSDLLANVGSTNRLGSNLLNTRQQQEIIVENAYSKLLSEGLLVEPANENYTQTPPIISGRYLGTEGQYKIIIRRGSQVTDYKMNVFGVESILDVDISTTGPTYLGNKGLFITFPDEIGSYVNTIWYVTIPNTKSSSYLANYNAYNAVKEGAIVTLTQTETTSEKIIVQESRVDQAQASLTTAQANLNKMTLRAPFTGIISAVNIDEGEIASINSPAVSLVSESEFEIKLDIPEADIANIEIGDQALVTFDAYDDVEFTAEVTFIAPTAKLVEGVPSFETTLRFLNSYNKIRSGLSADVEILATKAVDVLSVPARSLFAKDGKTFVRILMKDGSIKEQVVTVGLRGSLGTVEIKDGLKEGDEVVTFISEEVLQSLEADK